MNVMKMPAHRQPNSLEGLSLGQVCQQLDATCRRLQVLSQESTASQVLVYARQTIRPYYTNALPSLLRTRVIEETSRMLYGPAPDGSTLVSGPAPLYLLAVLLAPDIKRLKVNLCCYYGCSHQASLLKLIASEGAGLESLEIARSALLRLDNKLFRSAMMNTKNLLSLTLRNIASDSILDVIGKNCTKLLHLDVACSRQVSDSGLKRLLLQVELRDRSPTLPSLQRRRTHRPYEERRETSWSRVKTLISKLKMRSRKTIREDGHGVLLKYCESRNPVCDTLRVLNIANTGVTSAGVLLALANVTNLDSLAEYNHLGRVVEIMDRAFLDVKIPFRLTQARSCRTTTARLELLSQTCPKLEKLCISEPCHPPVALGLFPFVTCLTVQGVPSTSSWFNGFYEYLRNCGRFLKDLTLRVAPGEVHLHLDIRQVFLHCPRLERLVKDGSGACWLDGPDPPPLERLARVQLGRSVNTKTIGKVLALAPELVFFHLHSCYDLNDELLENFLTAPPVPRRRLSDRPFKTCLQSLRCFYVYEASHLTKTTVLNMFKYCRNLRCVGNLGNWGISCEELAELRRNIVKANLEVELCPGSHWFWSNCVN